MRSALVHPVETCSETLVGLYLTDPVDKFDPVKVSTRNRHQEVGAVDHLGTHAPFWRTQKHRLHHKSAFSIVDLFNLDEISCCSLFAIMKYPAVLCSP